MKKLLVACFTVLLAAVGGAAHAATVALFADTTYVDYSVGATGSEASNMEAYLVSAGHTVNTFTGTAAASWTAALAGASVLVIPEQENGALYPDLPAATVTVIRNFVSGGGTLIVGDAGGSNELGLVNGTFSYSMASIGASSSAPKTGAAASTQFASGPASIASLSATDPVDTTTMPSGYVCAYGTGSECWVYAITYGSGKVIGFAWDFYNEAPTGTAGATDWNPVLALAVSGRAPAGVPVLDARALALLMLAVALAGLAYSRRQA